MQMVGLALKQLSEGEKHPPALCILQLPESEILPFKLFLDIKTMLPKGLLNYIYFILKLII